MFINNTVFKRVLSNEFKSASGVTVAKLPAASETEFFMIAGREWIINMAADRLTNKNKAVLYEVLGVLPEVNECWTMTKNSIQTAMFPEWMNIVDAQHFRTQYHVTQVKCAGKQILQSGDLLSVKYANESLIELKSLKEFDEKTESSPVGPLATNISSEGHVGFLWRNEICALAVNNILPADDSAAGRLLEVCAGIDLTDK